MDEQQRLEILKQIDCSKSLQNRNQRGQFATPAPLAHEIVEVALTWLGEEQSIRYLEPGFGTSPFFASLIRTDRQLSASVGYEIDSDYADAAEWLYASTNLQLHRLDFLSADPPKSDIEKFNLIISNPPYVRHHHLSKDEKLRFREIIKERTQLDLSGLSGLYTYFLLGSKVWMSRDGIGVWLIPSEFMDVNYGRKVKEFLCSQVQLLRIHRFPPAALQFDDALVTSAVVFFRNATPQRTVQLSQGRSLITPDTTKTIAVSDLREAAKWTPVFTRSGQTSYPRTGVTLSDCFTIKRGIATGSNSYFVMTLEEAIKRSLPRQFLRPLLPNPRKLETDHVLADSQGVPLVRESRWLLSCHLPEMEIQCRYPTLWAYLQEGIERGVDQAYLCRHRLPWYRQEQRAATPFLCTYMVRSRGEESIPFRFVLNRSQATATNVYLMLYPKPTLDAYLDREERYVEVWEALCSVTTASLGREGRVYGGGLHKLEPKELANVDAGPLAEWMQRHNDSC